MSTKIKTFLYSGLFLLGLILIAPNTFAGPCNYNSDGTVNLTECGQPGGQGQDCSLSGAWFYKNSCTPESTIQSEALDCYSKGRTFDGVSGCTNSCLEDEKILCGSACQLPKDDSNTPLCSAQHKGFDPCSGACGGCQAAYTDVEGQCVAEVKTVSTGEGAYSIFDSFASAGQKLKNVLWKAAGANVSYKNAVVGSPSDAGDNNPAMFSHTDFQEQNSAALQQYNNTGSTRIGAASNGNIFMTIGNDTVIVTVGNSPNTFDVNGKVTIGNGLDVTAGQSIFRGNLWANDTSTFIGPSLFMNDVEVIGGFSLTPRATQPYSCDGAHTGGIYYDNTEREIRICSGSGGNSAWRDFRGPAPAHQWKGTELRFENPDGSMGAYVDLKGPEGPQGPEGPEGPPGSTPWSQNGSNIYYTDGNVGIGTSSPGAKLDVSGNVRVGTSIDVGGNSYTTSYLSKAAVGGLQNNKAVFAYRDRFNENDFALMQDSVGNTTLNSKTGISLNSQGTNKVIISDKVAVNTDFTVTGKTTFNGDVCIGGVCNSQWPGGFKLIGDGLEVFNQTLKADYSKTQARVSQSCPLGSSIRLITENGSIGCETDDVGSGDNLGDHTATQNIKLDGHWLSGGGNDEGIMVDNSGEVGIGTANPSAPLDIKGAIRMYNSEGSSNKTSIVFEGDSSLNPALRIAASNKATEGGSISLLNTGQFDITSVGWMSLLAGNSFSGGKIILNTNGDVNVRKNLHASGTLNGERFCIGIYCKNASSGLTCADPNHVGLIRLVGNPKTGNTELEVCLSYTGSDDVTRYRWEEITTQP